MVGVGLGMEEEGGGGSCGNGGEEGDGEEKGGGEEMGRGGGVVVQ